MTATYDLPPGFTSSPPGSADTLPLPPVLLPPHETAGHDLLREEGDGLVFDYVPGVERRSSGLSTHSPQTEDAYAAPAPAPESAPTGRRGRLAGVVGRIAHTRHAAAPPPRTFERLVPEGGTETAFFNSDLSPEGAAAGLTPDDVEAAIGFFNGDYVGVMWATSQGKTYRVTDYDPNTGKYCIQLVEYSADRDGDADPTAKARRIGGVSDVLSNRPRTGTLMHPPTRPNYQNTDYTRPQLEQWLRNQAIGQSYSNKGDTTTGQYAINYIAFDVPARREEAATPPEGMASPQEVADVFTQAQEVSGHLAGLTAFRADGHVLHVIHGDSGYNVVDIRFRPDGRWGGLLEQADLDQEGLRRVILQTARTTGLEYFGYFDSGQLVSRDNVEDYIGAMGSTPPRMILARQTDGGPRHEQIFHSPTADNPGRYVLRRQGAPDLPGSYEQVFSYLRRCANEDSTFELYTLP